MKRMRRHKRHFQLLELMVAAFILLVCIAPTMRIFTNMYLSQQEVIRENQRDHLAHHVHAKITELLYKRQLHIPIGDNNPAVVLSDSELIDELQKFCYTCEASLTVIDSTTPKDQEHPSRYLVQLVVKLKDVSPKAKDKKKKYENQDSSESFYDYYIYVDAGHKDKSNKSKNKKKDNDHTQNNPNGNSAKNPTQVKHNSQDHTKFPTANAQQQVDD